MKIGILYYSGAGNTECVAELLGAMIRQQPGCEILYQERITRNSAVGELPEADVIGIASPVHFGRLPERLLQAIKALPGGYALVYGVCTHSGNPGVAAKQLQQAAAQRRWRFNGSMLLRMPASHTLLLTAKRSRRAALLLKRQEPQLMWRLARWAGMMAAGQEDAGESWTLLGKDWQSGLGSWLQRCKWQNRSFQLQVLPGRCRRCRLCLEACPAGNIVWRDGYPEFKRDCELCLGCIHRCPAEAIQMGQETLYAARYVPHVTAEGEVSNCHPGGQTGDQPAAVRGLRGFILSDR